MSSSSGPAGGNSTHQPTNELNTTPSGHRFLPEDHQRPDLSPILIEDDEISNPESANSSLGTWDESPTARGLLLQKTSANTFDQLPAITANLFQRPISAGNLQQPTMFCFKPAHKPQQLQLGHQSSKPGHSFETRGTAVEDERTAIPSLNEISAGQTKKDTSRPEDVGDFELQPSCEKHPSLSEIITMSLDSPLPLNSQQGDVDEVYVKSSPSPLCCSPVEHSNDVAGSHTASEPHPSSTPMNDDSRDVADDIERITLTPVSGKSAQSREASQEPSHIQEISGRGNHVNSCKIGSTPLKASTTKRQHIKSRGNSHIDTSRVVKTLKTPPLQPKASRFSELPRDASHSNGIPTEEDLLYLLMSRTRDTAKSLRKLEALERQNYQLREEKLVSEAKLEEAEGNHRELLIKQDMMDRRLEAFKEKYYKLKTWALEANKDCELLQNKSIDLRNAVSELSKERDDLRTSLQSLTEGHSTHVYHMDTMHGLIRDVKQSAADQSAIVNRQNGLLQANKENLRKEQARCDRLEAHIAQIERHKTRQDQRFHDQRNDQNKFLQEVYNELKKMAAQQTGSRSDSKEILDSVRACQSLVQDQPTFISELSQIKDHFEGITQLINLRSKSALEILKGEIDNLRKAIELQSTADSQQHLQAVQECNIQLIKAKEQVAQLLQANEQSMTITNLLRDGKEAAESREADLKASTERLIETITEDRGSKKEHLDQLRSVNEALLAKFQAASSEAAEYKGQIDEKARQIKLLVVQLEDLQKEKGNIVERHQISLQERLLQEQRIRGEMDKKISESEKHIRELRADRNEQIQLRQQHERQSKELNERLSRAQEELKNSQSQSTQAIFEKQEQAKHMALLQEDLAKAQEKAHLFSQLQRDLAVKSAEMIGLMESQTKYEQVKQELLLQQDTTKQKTREIELLVSEVEDLHRKSVDLEEKSRDRAILAESKVHLEKEMHDLKRKLTGLQTTSERLESRNAELEQSQSVLDQAQKDLRRMREVEESNKTLTQKFDMVSLELATVNEKNEKLAAIEKLLSQKEETITRIEAELKSQASVFGELVKTKQELTSKDNDLSRLEERILTLETERATMAPPRPVRRAANRSTESAHPLQSFYRSELHHHGDEMDPIQATGLVDADTSIPPAGSFNITSSQSVIADTQPEIPETLQDLPHPFDSPLHNLELLDLQETGDTSSLTDIADPFDADEPLENEGNTFLEEAETTLATPHKLPAGPLLSAAERPPSSSYGSMNEHMLLDFGLNGGTQSRPTSRNNRASHESEHAEHLLQSQHSKKTGASSRRLRSESHTQGKPSADSPKRPTENLNDRESTPSMSREKHRPNSAVKRKMEQSEVSQSSKQLKRTPANLEISVPRHSQSTAQKGEKSPPKKIVTFRRSSVVGTNAPAPGKAQKTSKPPRKGSRQERYSNRFGTEN